MKLKGPGEVFDLIFIIPVTYYIVRVMIFEQLYFGTTFLFSFLIGQKQPLNQNNVKVNFVK